MKKLLLVLLLFTGMVNAQPPAITNPQNHIVFDFGNDNYELFEVYTMVPEILGTLNSNDYAVKFYLDASFQNLITEGAGTFTYYNNNQTVYVKVTETANPNNFATTSFNILLIATPIIGQPQDIFQTDIPFDAVGVFDLTSQSAAIINGLTGVTLAYFPTPEDATALTNEIANPVAYTNIANPQNVCARVTNQNSGSYSITQFRIVLTSVETITIPDPYFKLRLLERYDTNNDDIVQLSEALSVTNLDLSNADIWNNPVSDLTGIENFTNVKQLFIGRNPLGVVDLSSLINLEYLDMFSTNATSLNVTGLTNLKSINCDTGQLTSLDVSTCTALESLFCARNQITSLNITGLTGITLLYCNNNLLTTLDVSNLTGLTNLCCSDNALSELNLNGLNNITMLCYGNLSMNAVDFSNLANLTFMAYGGGLATTLNLNTAPNLQSFWAWGTNLTELDLSNSPLLNVVRLFGNPDLTYVNMKNGGQFLFSDEFQSYNTEFQSNPNLFYVCTNEFDQEPVNHKLTLNNTSDNGVAHAGTYCTFVPGGNYNTITGTIRFDSTNNGCDATDVIQPNIKVNINDGTTIGSTFIENSGAYHFYTQTGSFDVIAEIENPSWFNITPAIITVPFANNNNNIATENFCLTSNGVHPDVEIVLTPDGIARPGFDAKYKLHFKNKGNQVLSGSINLSFDEARTDFVSALPNVQGQVVGNLTWTYTNLLPFENRSINLVLNINSPMETPPVNSGDILNFTASINPIIDDELPLDNQFDFHQSVINSFDPNAITCLEGETVAPERIGEYLHYLVQFENTGTASAVNIVVKDVIDETKFDINSLQVISASADQRTVITGNVVEFIFENINLERNSGQPPVGGHGDILFKIKTKNGLVTGDNVVNNANIYFDYNFPIGTGDAQTTFAALNNLVFEIDNSIKIYPNPTSAMVNIVSEYNIVSIELYDVQGRILETVLETASTSKIDLSHKSKGIYFLKIKTESGSKIEKIVKK